MPTEIEFPTQEALDALDVLLGSGTTQTVSLLGPFHVLFSDLDGDGRASLVALPQGSIVATAIVSALDWAASDAGSMAMTVLTVANGGQNQSPIVVADPLPSGLGDQLLSGLGLFANAGTASIALSACSLVFECYANGSGATITAGSADVYALIATSA